MIALLALIACTHGLDTATLDVAGHPVTAELAVTPDQREQGLMFRKTMAQDDGMLFVYPDEQPRSFWMKNTSLPLAIAFADRYGVIVTIAEMQPYDEGRTQSLYPAMYALEMNTGWFAKNNVTTGQKIAGMPKDAAK